MSKRAEALRVSRGEIAEALDPAVQPMFHLFPGTTVTVCCLVMRNGFAVLGEAGCSTPEHFDAEMGKALALESAETRVWGLLGYAKREAAARV